MKRLFTYTLAFVFVVLGTFAAGAAQTEAQTNFGNPFFNQQGTFVNPYQSYWGGYQNYQPWWQYYYPNYQENFDFRNRGNGGSSSSDDDEPDVQTDSVQDEDEDSAELNGEVDMNDFNDGIVFFVYGQDEDMIEDVEGDYDTYDDVEDDEEDDDFEVVRVDRDLDGDDEYSEDINGLEEDEEYFVILCVEYEDEDGDETLECGDVEDFETDEDNSNNDEEPDVDTNTAVGVDDNSARLRGDVDMNDFNDGIVFFVYGQDENMIEDVEDDYDTYDDVDDDEEDDDFEVVRVDTDLDGQEDYERNVSGLEEDEEYFFIICVEYEDEDNDETLECGSLEEFETDD